MTQPAGRAARAGVPESASRPDFVLPNQFGEPVASPRCAVGNVVVVFYPFAFSGICTGELCQLRDNIAEFATAQPRVLAVSVDSKYRPAGLRRAERLEFDLLADFWPHGEVARRYGVFNAERGMAERGTFIIDADGIVRCVVRQPARARPGSWPNTGRPWRDSAGADR